MSKVVKIGEHEFYIDGYMQQNLDIAKSVIRKDFDMILAVDGPEGSGKSVLTMQLAYYCDPTFVIDRVVFNPNQLKKAIVNSKKYQAIVYDEAYTGLSSRAAMSMINRTLISMLAEIRQKNLFIFVVMPCFFDLDKYVALWRSRALIHIYTGDNFERGFFAFYNVEKKKDLYLNGKKLYNYTKPGPNFRGRFTNHYVVDETEYKKLKLESLNRRSKEDDEKEFQLRVRTIMLERLVTDKFIMEKVPHSVKARILGISEPHFYKLMRDYFDMKEFS